MVTKKEGGKEGLHKLSEGEASSEKKEDMLSKRIDFFWNRHKGVYRYLKKKREKRSFCGGRVGRLVLGEGGGHNRDTKCPITGKGGQP